MYIYSIKTEFSMYQHYAFKVLLALSSKLKQELSELFLMDRLNSKFTCTRENSFINTVVKYSLCQEHRSHCRDDKYSILNPTSLYIYVYKLN